MTFASCERWVAAAFLRDHSMPYPDPPCDHDPDCCPPLKPKTQETSR